MSNSEFESIYQEHFSPVLAKATDLVIERGEGPYLYTVEGERYLDLVQGIAVNALGHCHPALVEAAASQFKRIAQPSLNLVSVPSILELGSELSRHTPGDLDMFFFANSGAEAVEGALKLARYVTRRCSVIAFRGSFHGRTMGAISVTASKSGFRQHYAPFVPQVYFAPYPYCFRCSFNQKPDSCGLECLAYLKQDLDYYIPANDVSAVLFEPVQGEGGYITPPQRYVDELQALCQKHNWLFIADEVQTGMGRTGKLFACEHFGIKPDILCLGKAIGGGLPLSVVASRKEIMGQWPAGAHGSTFGGHPVAAAAALALLKIVSQPEFLADVQAKGLKFRQGLKELQAKNAAIGDVRGIGLMNAVELVTPDGAPDPDLVKQVVAKLREKKILVLNCGVYAQALRFIPPLNIEDDLLMSVVGALAEALG
ncbi:MAG: aminotransferase class III-fold pyridoxal phosphate-dependent enzyme [Desulfarculaceae bacterium]|jgi:4-aminobutyrate aminotransferase